MTYDETTQFWRFLENKGMKQNYLYFYNHHRFDGRDIDTFLEQTDAEDAILSAFDLAAAPNTIFSPKYWQELNEKWFRKLEEYRADGKMIDQPTVTCGHCKRLLPRSSYALNPKGQLHKYCRECESGEWDRKRKEQEAAAKEKEKQEKAVRQLEKEIAEKQAKLERLAAEHGTDATAAQPEADDAASRYSPKLGEHDATLHYKTDVKKIVFNAVLSAYVYTAGLTKCYLEAKRDGRQFLVFNNAEGANVTWLASKSSRLAQVCSTAHCRQIAEYFHLAIGELYYLHVTKNLSKVQDTINVEIKQVHTREEYAAIAARREEELRNGRPVPGEDVPEWQEPDTEEHCNEPLIDFGGEEEKAAPVVNPGPAIAAPMKATKVITAGPETQKPGISLTGKNPSDILQQLIDRGHMKERDIAKFLCDRGWKLQEPVVVTTYKKFKA